MLEEEKVPETNLEQPVTPERKRRKMRTSKITIKHDQIRNYFWNLHRQIHSIKECTKKTEIFSGLGPKQVKRIIYGKTKNDEYVDDLTRRGIKISDTIKKVIPKKE